MSPPEKPEPPEFHPLDVKRERPLRRQPSPSSPPPPIAFGAPPAFDNRADKPTPPGGARVGHTTGEWEAISAQEAPAATELIKHKMAKVDAKLKPNLTALQRFAGTFATFSIAALAPMLLSELPRPYNMGAACLAAGFSAALGVALGLKSNGGKEQ